MPDEYEWVRQVSKKKEKKVKNKTKNKWQTQLLVGLV